MESKQKIPKKRFKNPKIRTSLDLFTVPRLQQKIQSLEHLPSITKHKFQDHGPLVVERIDMDRKDCNSMSSFLDLPYYTMPTQYVRERLKSNAPDLQFGPFNDDFCDELTARRLNQKSNGILKLMPFPRVGANFVDLLSFAEGSKEWHSGQHRQKIYLSGKGDFYTMPYIYASAMLGLPLRRFNELIGFSFSSDMQPVREHSRTTERGLPRFMSELLARRLNHMTRGGLVMLKLSSPLENYTLRSLSHLCKAHRVFKNYI